MNQEQIGLRLSKIQKQCAQGLDIIVPPSLCNMDQTLLKLLLYGIAIEGNGRNFVWHISDIKRHAKQ